MELARLGQALGERWVAGHEQDDTDQIVKSAGRVLRILELFDVLKREALVSEVSELLGLPQSSTSVLLRSLVVMGYLSYNAPTRAFAPTTRVALLGNWVNAPLLSDGPLIRLMHRLNVRTGQAVVLAIRNHIWSQYIHVVQATNPMRIYVVKGSRRPLACSATGLTLISDLPDSEITRIGLRYNAEPQEVDVKVPVPVLHERINAVRTNGYAFQHDTVTVGAGVIAMRLPTLENSDERLSIGIAAPTQILLEHKDEYAIALHEEIAVHLVQSTTSPVANCMESASS
ncbi:IclR family transcriptional regulator [Novosphingobium taihuense]|uniref:DNA-binding IclR family transcriptional regulator n=1 Tax=Novosphingobium taihuense TaxID=260085 RepID=A0A7W7ACC2_9SPHN|nr:helix-turn-helix domain-containing protein [Novosphingobium taihuense]MBB4614306.1 DNA-binding IclR family transcriptional regulator [Novosphingobium taihuense]TWH87152.1 IclR family transcriptional regulator [Novosphingobium taihuense]